MRIISGKFKGRQISLPRGAELRPTSERVREAVFSMLYSICNIEDVCVFDLFAGSGAYGLEAISRGALSCVFVEKEKKLAQNIEATIKLLNIQNSCRVVFADALKIVCEAKLSINNGQRSLIFADPPYDYQHHTELLSGMCLLSENLENVLFVLETLKKAEVDKDVCKLQESELKYIPQVLKEKIHGDTKITFIGFKKKS